MKHTNEKPISRLLTLKETAEILGIHPQTIYSRTAPKSDEKFPIPVKRVGRLLRFDRRDVESYIARI